MPAWDAFLVSRHSAVQYLRHLNGDGDSKPWTPHAGTAFRTSKHFITIMCLQCRIVPQGPTVAPGTCQVGTTTQLWKRKTPPCIHTQLLHNSNIIITISIIVMPASPCQLYLYTNLETPKTAHTFLIFFLKSVRCHAPSRGRSSAC